MSSYHGVLATGQRGKDEGAVVPGQSTAQVDQRVITRLRPLHWGRVAANNVLETQDEHNKNCQTHCENDAVVTSYFQTTSHTFETVNNAALPLC